MHAGEVEILIDKYGTDVYRFCTKLCSNKHDTEDLYQQTFLRMMEIDKNVKWDENPKAFLFSITNSIWKNKIRKQARRNRIAPSVTIKEDNENLLVDVANVEHRVISNTLNDELYEIIQSLPDKFRIPIILYYSFEIPLGDIAKITKIPTGTVKSRLHKGRGLIKKKLEEKGYEHI